MAASEILAKYGTTVKPACGWESLANGAGRISAVVDNTATRAAMALIAVRVKTGTTPTVNTPVKVYLIRRSNDGVTDIADAALGTADAAVATEPTGAELLGSIIVTATSNVVYEQVFKAYDLPPKYSILLWNATAVALNASTAVADQELEVVPVTYEAQ